MTEPRAAERIVVISYMLWALSVPLAMSFHVILLMRLVLHNSHQLTWSLRVG